MGVNKVIMIGRVWENPNTRFFPDDSMQANFWITVQNEWLDKATGEVKSKEHSQPVCIRGKPAEIASKLVRKGVDVYVEGPLITNTYPSFKDEQVQLKEVVIDNDHGQFLVIKTPAIDKRGRRDDRRIGVTSR